MQRKTVVSKIIIILSLLLCLSLQANTLTLAWNWDDKTNYTIEELTTKIVFNLYYSSGYANPFDWKLATNIVGTNLICTVNLPRGFYAFTITASNTVYQLESIPSNIYTNKIPAPWSLSISNTIVIPKEK
jgi:hypothetical protein